MPEKYIYNGQIVQRSDVEDAAKQSNLDVNAYLQKSGIKVVNDNYDFNGKTVSAEDILSAANQSKLGFDDYIQKANISAIPDVKKKEATSEGFTKFVGTVVQQPSGGVSPSSLKLPEENKLSPDDINSIRNFVQDNTGTALLNKKTPPPQAIPPIVDLNKEDPIGDRLNELKASNTEVDNKIQEELQRLKSVNKNITGVVAGEELSKSIISSIFKRQELQNMAEDAFASPEIANEYLSKKLSTKDILLKPKNELVQNPVQAIFAKPEKVNGQSLDNFDLTDIAASINPKNVTEKLAFDKYQRGRNIDEAIKVSGITEDAALKYAASQNPQLATQLDKLKGVSKDKYDALVGTEVMNFLYNPDLIAKAKTNPDLQHQWIEKENNLYNDYPALAKRIVAQKIAQAREDRGMGGLLIDIPGAASVDPLVEELMKSGVMDARDKEVYENQIKPQFGALKSFGRGVGNILVPAFTNEAPIPTTDFLGSLADSYKNTLRGTAHSVEDLINTVTPPLEEKPFNKDARLADVLQRDYSTVTVNPKSFLSDVAQSTGHLTGFILPMIIGGEAGAGAGLSRTGSELITNGLIFEGQNHDAAIKMFPDNEAKQLAYTAIATGGDMMLGKLLPTKEAIAGIKSSLRPEIEKVITDFTDNKITAAAAKQTIFDKATSLITEKAPEILQGNAKVGTVMSTFSIFHNALDAAFGGRDVSLDDAANEAVQSFKAGFLGSTPLTIAGMLGKDTKLTGQTLREMASNRDFFKQVIEDGAQLNPELEATKNERISNLNDAAIINKDLEDAPLTEAQKQKYLLNGVVEKVWQKKAEATTDETIKADYLKKANDAKAVKDKIWSGEDKAPEFQPQPEEVTLTEEQIKTGEPQPTPEPKSLFERASEVASENGKLLIGEQETPEGIKALTEQSVDAPMSTLESFNNRDVVTDAIAKNSEEAINKSIENWQKRITDLPDNAPEETVNTVTKTVDDNISLLEEGLAKKQKPETQQPEKALTEEGKGAAVIMPAENKPVVERPIIKTQGQLSLVNTETKEIIPITDNEKLKTVQPPQSAEANTKAYVEYPPTSLNYMGTGKLETEFQLNERQETERKRDLTTIREADDLLDKGWDVQKKIDDIENGESIGPSDAEYVNMTRYAAELAQRIREARKAKDFSSINENLNELNRVTAAANAGGKETARALGIRGRFKTVAEGSYEEFMLNEKVANGNAPLTDKQIEISTKDYSDLETREKKLNEDIKAFEDKVAAFKAEEAVKKIRKEVLKDPRRKREFLEKEREDIIERIKEKWKNAGKDRLSSDIPFRQQIVAVVPDVLKLARNLVEDGIISLKEITGIISDTVDIPQRDVHDILAGEYSEKKPTKREAAIQYENVRIEAKLINKLDKLMKGEEPRNEKKLQERNKQIEDLKKQIKDFREATKEQNKFATEEFDPEFKRLDTYRKSLEAKTKKLKEKLDKGDFEPEEKRIPVLDDPEMRKKFPETFKAAQKSFDDYIEVKRNTALRLAKKMYENKTDAEKTADVLLKVAGIPRTIMASYDFSAPLRQGLVASVNHPVMASQALKFMFQSAKNEKIYNRWLADVHKDPDFKVAEKIKLGITDPASLHLQQQEEAFQGAQYAEWIPGVKASERAYVGYLNHLRWNLFKMYSERFKDQGKTYENNPKLYEGLASMINSETGRGNMKALEKYSPVLNFVLFSSRLIASRLNMLGLTDIPNVVVRGATLGKRGLDYGFYTRLPRELRIEAAKDMLRLVAVGTATLLLFKHAFGADVESDPRSSDFGKIRVGNTRWDIWGGFQPYARVLTQMVTGQRKPTTGGKVYDIKAKRQPPPEGSLLRSKLSPVVSGIWDVRTGEDAAGQPVTVTKALVQRIFPLLGQDVYTAMQDQGVKALFTVGIPSAFGVGVNTYDSSKRKK